MDRKVSIDPQTARRKMGTGTKFPLENLVRIFKHFLTYFEALMPIFAQADARRRITLPPSAGIKPGDPMEVDVLSDGRVVITPIVAIPRHQLWAWKPEVMERVSAALTDARPGVKIESEADFDALARDLGIEPDSLTVE
jgi:bifunctional DNA-binding transcriptional regulator/antitoxin component of YhaV-PrlF toxin-antitoxin module